MSRNLGLNSPTSFSCNHLQRRPVGGSKRWMISENLQVDLDFGSSQGLGKPPATPSSVSRAPEFGGSIHAADPPVTGGDEAGMLGTVWQLASSGSGRTGALRGCRRRDAIVGVPFVWHQCSGLTCSRSWSTAAASSTTLSLCALRS